MSTTVYREILTAAQSGGALICQSCGSYKIKAVPSPVPGSIFLLCQNCNTRFTGEALELEIATPDPEPHSTQLQDEEEGEQENGVEEPLEEAQEVEEEQEEQELEEEENDGEDPDEEQEEGEESQEIVLPSPSTIEALGLLHPEDLDTARVHTFYRQIGSVMRDNLNERHVGGQRSGRLDGRSLHKVFAGASRVFTKKGARGNKGYNIVLVVDCSGSMLSPIPGGATRIGVAAEAARMMVKGLTRHNLEVAVVAHSTYGTVILKDWTSGADFNADQLYQELVEHADGNNQDYVALCKAEDLLNQRKNGYEEIVLVICDGELYVDKKSIIDKRTGQRVDVVLGHVYQTKVGFGAVYDMSGARALSGELVPYTPENFRLLQLCRDLQKRAAFITISIDCHRAFNYYPNVHVVHDSDSFIETIMRELRRAIKRG